jgi:hypothetical protein
VLNGKLGLFSNLPRLLVVEIHVGAFLVFGSLVGRRIVSPEPRIVLCVVAPVSVFELLGGEILLYCTFLTIKYEEKSLNIYLADHR